MLFEKYKKAENTTKVLWLYLLLDGKGNPENLDRVELEDKELSFGTKIVRAYGYSKQAVDAKLYQKEILDIETPVICSKLSYEYYAKDNKIYVYTPKKTDKGEVFFVGDMNIIGRTMVIEDNIIVTSKLCSDESNPMYMNGFQFFKDYVLKGQFILGDWDVSYINNVFDIKYVGKTIYKAIELDKTSTYKFVIYIIRKLAGKEDKPVDCYNVEAYKLREDE